MKCKCLLLVCLLLLSTLFVGCQAQPQTVKGVYFDTLVELTAYGEKVPDEALELCRKYDRLLSATNKDSEIYKLNQAGEYDVSKETLEIIKAAVGYGEKSEGLFDISVRPLSALWNFTAEEPALPDDTQLKKALESVGYEKIKISGTRVALPSGGGIDLGGIAKGYIADRIAEIYKEKGLSGIINLGGNVLTVGKKPTGEAFKIGIKKPFSQNETACYLQLTGGSAATCGVYERYFTIDGEIYHHILNPRTGYPEVSNLHSVTVVAQNSADADALSTTLFLMGEEKAKEYLQTQEGIHAVFIREDGSVSLSHGLIAEKDIIKIK